MTNDVRTMEDQLPAETSVPSDVEARIARALSMRTKGSQFYQGTVNLPRYNKTLIGEGFFITSDVQYRTQPKNEKREFASEVVQFTIRRISEDRHGKPILLAPELATLSGAYLLNQVRSMTINELHAYPWTVWENDLFEIRQQADGRHHPYMLALYDSRAHQPPEIDDGDSELARDPIGPHGRLSNGKIPAGFDERDFPAPDKQAENRARVWQEDWTQFNTQIRAWHVTLSEAREFLGMQEGETWQGRDLAEDLQVIKALMYEPGEPPESPQEEIVTRGRGRPRKPTNQ